jgi:5-methylcytosine-specific restriction endonuclease McrA
MSTNTLEYRRAYYRKNREKILAVNRRWTLLHRKYVSRAKFYPAVCEWCKEVFNKRRWTQRFCGSIKYKTGCSYKNRNSYRTELYKRHPEWRATSHNRRSAKLQVAGWFSSKEWLELKTIYNHTCPFCLRSEPEISLTVDHKIPIAKSGSNYIDNIQPLCMDCNRCKHLRIWFASCKLDHTAWTTKAFS